MWKGQEKRLGKRINTYSMAYEDNFVGPNQIKICLDKNANLEQLIIEVEASPLLVTS